MTLLLGVDARRRRMNIDVPHVNGLSFAVDAAPHAWARLLTFFAGFPARRPT